MTAVTVQLGTALLLGLVGSLHCAGMCGPLALALPAGRSTSSAVLGRLLYNAGRLMTYALLGGVFGLLGESLALIGLQRWLSLAAGVVVLAGLAASSRYALHLPLTRVVTGIKSGFASLLQRRTTGSLLLLGVLNGFLPCGLVYAACAGAAATGGWTASLAYMLVFGLGTVPMMLGIGLAGRKVRVVLRFKYQDLIPVSVAVLGVLLILRGLALGIPYLSPDLSGAACH